MERKKERKSKKENQGSGTESRIGIAGLELPEIPEREAKNESNLSKSGVVENRFRIAIRITSYQCLKRPWNRTIRIAQFWLARFSTQNRRFSATKAKAPCTRREWCATTNAWNGLMLCRCYSLKFTFILSCHPRLWLRRHPGLLFLAFWNSWPFFLSGKGIPCFLSVFLFFPRRLRVRRREIPFFLWFSFFSYRNGKETKISLRAWHEKDSTNHSNININIGHNATSCLDFLDHLHLLDCHDRRRLHLLVLGHSLFLCLCLVEKSRRTQPDMSCIQHPMCQFSVPLLWNESLPYLVFANVSGS